MHNRNSMMQIIKRKWRTIVKPTSVKPRNRENIVQSAIEIAEKTNDPSCLAAIATRLSPQDAKTFDSKPSATATSTHLQASVTCSSGEATNKRAGSSPQEETTGNKRQRVEHVSSIAQASANQHQPSAVSASVSKDDHNDESTSSTSSNSSTS